MAESSRQLFSIGVFLVIIVVAILLFGAGIIGWELIIPVILVFSGCWTLVLAVIRSSNPQKYERGAFSTMGLGLFMIAVGGAWYMLVFGQALYALALILLVLGALAIAAALKPK